MKKHYFLIVFGILFSLLFNPMQAQNNNSTSKSDLSFGADLVSRYIWRGQQLGSNVPAIQPNISFTYGGFEAGVWGSFTVAGGNLSQEVDLYLSQSVLQNMITLTVTDYFFPEEFGDYSYFKYGKDVTGHVFEGMLSYNGIEKFPLTAMVAVNFYGADAARIENDAASPDFNEKTGIQYSTYVELGYPFKIKDIDISTFIGFNATKPRKADTNTGYIGETGFYGDKIGVVNVGFTASKSIGITKKYALPVNISLVTNPQSQKIYFVFGISF